MRKKSNIITKLYTSDFTKESVYVLGLLWADGHISKKNSIALECLKVDTDLFYPIFQKTGKWNRTFRDRFNRRPQSTIQATNKTICNFLRTYTYSPHNIDSPDKIIKLIPNNLRRYWYLGYSDGDGSWYIHIKQGLYQFTCSGPHKQDWSFIEELFNNLNIKYGIQRITNKKSSYSAIRSTNKHDVSKLGDFLYQNYNDDNIGLKRKYDKYILIKERL